MISAVITKLQQGLLAQNRTAEKSLLQTLNEREERELKNLLKTIEKVRQQLCSKKHSLNKK